MFTNLFNMAVQVRFGLRPVRGPGGGAAIAGADRNSAAVDCVPLADSPRRRKHADAIRIVGMSARRLAAL